MKIELFQAPGCHECAAAEASLKDAAEEAAGTLDWRVLNPVDELDYAVELGVLTLPAIAIDGELVFTSLPTPEQLRDALALRLSKEAQHGS